MRPDEQKGLATYSPCRGATPAGITLQFDNRNQALLLGRSTAIEDKAMSNLIDADVKSQRLAFVATCESENAKQVIFGKP